MSCGDVLPGGRTAEAGTENAGTKEMAFSGMGKTGGDKMRAVGQAGSVEERKKTKRDTGKAGGLKGLERETERLRSELATEKQRAKALEETSSRVAERLDAAIESVKAILARQG